MTTNAYGHINYDALASIEDRQRRAFARAVFPATSPVLSDRYVQGETFLIDDALSSAEYDVDLYAMVIGEAPGAQEDSKLRPFVGQAGILLRRLLEDVSIPPAWITNVVKFRPAGNKTPDEAQIELAKPYLRAEWEAIGKPRTIICMGNTPLKAVTGRAGVTKRAGMMEQWPASDGAPIYLWPMLHPSFVLRSPGHRAWLRLTGTHCMCG